MPEFNEPNKNKKKSDYNIGKTSSPGKSGVAKGRSLSQSEQNMRKTSRTVSKNTSSKKKKKRKKQISRPPVKKTTANNNYERNKKNRSKQNNIIYYCMFAFLFVVLVSVLSVTVLFNAKEYLIEGESIYSNEEIFNASEIPEEVNLIRYDPSDAVQKILDKLVYLDEVEIRKDYPSRLTIKVVGAEKMAEILLPDGSYLIISKHGRILERITKNSINQVVIIGYEPSVTEIGATIKSETPRKEELVFKLISEIEEAGLEKIREIDISDYLNIVLNYNDKVRIIIGPSIDLQDKLVIAKGILDSEISENETGTLNLLTPLKARFLPDIAAEGYDIFNEDSVTSEENPEINSESDPDTGETS